MRPTRAWLFDSQTRFCHVGQATCVCRRGRLVGREQFSCAAFAMDPFRHLTGYLVRNPG
jgi:hypothetical protein